MELDREYILNYRINSGTTTACVTDVMAWVGSGASCRWLACFNPHSYAVACERPDFSRALRDADWLVPDGAGIVLASHVLGGAIRERVTGSDVFREVNSSLSKIGGSVFLLGATEDTLAAMRARLVRELPALRVAGTYSPPFKDKFSVDEDAEMIAAVNAATPDVLWVGMTSPKQDLWISKNRHRLNVKFAAAIGAVFDFYSGRVKRSHPAFQRLGLEWLPRLVQEPRRLWRRMFVSAPIFLWDVARARFGLSPKCG